MKKKIVFKKKYITFLLIYFVLFTSYFSILTLSKYVSTSEKAGTSTIAKWEVFTDTSDNENDTLNIVSGNTPQNYILKVTSTSEVAATYSVFLTNLPDELEISIDNGEYQIPVNNEIIFINVGSFNASDNNSTHEHTLTFNAPLDSNIEEVNEISLDVLFEQNEI